MVSPEKRYQENQLGSLSSTSITLSALPIKGILKGSADCKSFLWTCYVDCSSCSASELPVCPKHNDKTFLSTSIQANC